MPPVEVASPGTVLPPHHSRCFACGDGPGSLGLRLTIVDDRAMTCEFLVTDQHQGAPGLAHGGVIAAVFDEALGALQHLIGETAVTASLSTRYRRPVPVGSVLFVRSRIERRDGRKLHVSAVGHLDGPDGPVAAEGTALFVVVPAEHFEQGRAEDVEAARLEREARPATP